jgi:hypothetical protein
MYGVMIFFLLTWFYLQTAKSDTDLKDEKRKRNEIETK